MAKHPTRFIAEKIVTTRIDDAPVEAVRIARDLFFDTVGVMLAGAAEPGTRMLHGVVRKAVGDDASVLGTPIRTSSFLAALANGTAAAILDYDDNSWRMLHPSGCVVPAVLALGEELGSTGTEALEAYMVGYEATGKIALGVPKLYWRGRHTTGTLGVLGATAACAKLLRLDVEQTATALGIAASCAGALRGNHGTMAKGLHSGQAAADGLLAACLAGEGFTARQDILECTYGLAHASLPDGEYDLEAFGAGWGEPWEFLEPDAGPGIKFIPSGTTSFCAAECAVEIANRHHPNPDDIAAVDWRTTPVSLDIARYGVPEDRNQAFYSVPWAIAAGLIDGRVGLSQYDADRISDPRRLALCAKVKLSLHPDLKKTTDPSQSVAGELVVRLKDGTEHRHMRLRPRAYPRGEPWTRDQLVTKYREAARRVLPAERAEASIPLASDLRSLSNVRDLTALLATS